MHERKAIMVDRADAFVALPGGYGTFDELFETLTWLQLGIHAKPIILFDVDGFFAPLLALADQAVRAGFLKPVHRDAAIHADSVAAVLTALSAPPAAPVPKWLDDRPKGVNP